MGDKVLSWRVSNTTAQRSHGVMSAKPTGDVAFCIEALEEALARFGHPEIPARCAASSRQHRPSETAKRFARGSQFTAPRFTGVLQQAGVKVSMDGRGRWMDNVFIERPWRSLKRECVHLHAFETGSELRAGLSRWIGYYNARRPHSTLAGRTPDETYGASGMGVVKPAA